MLRTVGHAADELSTAYFHPSNVERVNFALRERTRLRTGYVIEPQRPEDLMVVMRAVYVLNARHLPCDLQEQVTELNEKALAECMPMVASGIEQRMGYLRDASQMHTPIAHGKYTSSRGEGALSTAIGFN
jgi:hypothetical protein